MSAAVAFHGGEAAGTRARFEEPGPRERSDVVASLENLVLFFPAEE